MTSAERNCDPDLKMGSRVRYPDQDRLMRDFPDLLPFREAFGDEVVVLGVYSSGTETAFGQSTMNASTAQWLPTGRPRRRDGKGAMFGAQVCYMGNDVDAFRAVIARARRTMKRKTIPWTGTLWVPSGRG